MSARTDQFCGTLRDRLSKVEGQLKTMGTNIQALPEQGEKALREKVDETRRKLQAEKDRVNTIRSNIKARAEEKMHETKEAVSEWKTKREIRKLNARADRDEAYAADATDFAVASIAEAELAVLDAVVARLDADAAQSPAPAAH